MTTGTYAIVGGDYMRGGEASRALKECLKEIGAQPDAIRRAMIAAYEAEMNVVIHAHRGNLFFTLDAEQVEVKVSDEGCGIPDITLAMQEGYSTAPPEARELGFGAGMGLPNIRKNTDRFAIESVVGRGTLVGFTIYLKPHEVSASSRNSLRIVAGLCRECLECVRHCPTRAIRVRNGRPEILERLCVDCAVCLGVCRTAALAMSDAGDAPAAKSAAVLILPASFLVQFGPGIGPERVLAALAGLGFQNVQFLDAWEQALHDAVTQYAQEEARGQLAISPACPAVVNLIEVRFPSLLPNLAPFLSPVEAAAADAGAAAALVVLCPSQLTALRGPSLPGKVSAISLKSLRDKVLPIAVSRGEKKKEARRMRAARRTESTVLRVHGIRHVMGVLEAAENGLLNDVRILEAFVCDEGCAGSPLLTENPFVARRRLGSVSTTTARAKAIRRTAPFAARPGMRLDPDMASAIRKLSQISDLAKSLPGRNCCRCGAPTCLALAEDIALGRATMAACAHQVHKL